ANTEYLIYQTLVGAWPLSAERLRGYLYKAIHEAKSHTSWIEPDLRYDEAIDRFGEAILDPARSARFLEDFVPFQQRVARFGLLNTLAQTLVKITTPGIPDFYQGTELWDLNLVDPDNRRPVDFALRQRTLEALVAEIESGHELAGLAQDLTKRWEDGRIKLFVIRQALACRRRHPGLFIDGVYRPLDVEGPLTEHLCAFARGGSGQAALTVVPRLLARRGSDEPPLGRQYWGEGTRVVVPAEVGDRFVNALTAERLAVTDGGIDAAGLFASFPVALLVTDET
ncbi:MAG: malto-oligosyltrehalose synthase, partial [Candidatus Rokuibacteriota bacterium]